MRMRGRKDKGVQVASRDVGAATGVLVKIMNIDPGMTAGYVMVATGGFAIGALAGRWMMTEMRTGMSAVQTRLSALEQMVIGHSTTTTSTATPSTNNSAAPVQPPASIMRAAAAPLPAPAPAPVAPPAPAAPTAAAAQAAALEHHASAVEKLAAAVDKHAQAVDDHGAATVAAALELGSHPAPVAPAATFTTPVHATGVAMGASVAPVAAAAVAAAPQS
jgi:hypothetical protein